MDILMDSDGCSNWFGLCVFACVVVLVCCVFVRACFGITDVVCCRLLDLSACFGLLVCDCFLFDWLLVIACR